MKLIQGKIFYELNGGRRAISCECIGEPYSSEIVSAYTDEIERLRAALTIARQYLDDNTPAEIVAQIESAINQQSTPSTEKP